MNVIAYIEKGNSIRTVVQREDKTFTVIVGKWEPGMKVNPLLSWDYPSARKAFTTASSQVRRDYNIYWAVVLGLPLVVVDEVEDIINYNYPDAVNEYYQTEMEFSPAPKMATIENADNSIYWMADEWAAMATPLDSDPSCESFTFTYRVPGQGILYSKVIKIDDVGLEIERLEALYGKAV